MTLLTVAVNVFVALSAMSFSWNCIYGGSYFFYPLSSAISNWNPGNACRFCRSQHAGQNISLAHSLGSDVEAFIKLSEIPNLQYSKNRNFEYSQPRNNDFIPSQHPLKTLCHFVLHDSLLLPEDSSPPLEHIDFTETEKI